MLYMYSLELDKWMARCRRGAARNATYEKWRVRTRRKKRECWWEQLTRNA